MVGLGKPLQKPGSSHSGVCRSVHLVDRLAILVARLNGRAELLTSVQHYPDDPGILIGHGDDGTVHVRWFELFEQAPGVF
jgi:hypothetical protein